MSRRSVSVKSLAQQAGLELDEALVTLWDAGLTGVNSSESTIHPRDLRVAYKALDLQTGKEQKTVQYWLEQTNLTRDQFESHLKNHGINLSTNARRLPKNSQRIIARLFNKPAKPQPEPSRVSLEKPAKSLPPLSWEKIGTATPTLHLNEQQINAIHKTLEDDYATSNEPIVPGGVRDQGLLSSAAHRPLTALGGVHKYPTVEMAAAALFHSIALNHAFHNGNKRTALVSLLAFLDANNHVLTCSEDDLFRMTLRVAQRGLVLRSADQLADREVQEIARWIRNNSRRKSQCEYPLKWIKLKQRLSSFDCETSLAPSVGNRINIRRPVRRTGRFGIRKKVVILQTQVAFAGDGTEADRNTIHKIRKDLELDDSHGVDSDSFYFGSQVDSFIIEYRRILDRLAKL